MRTRPTSVTVIGWLLIVPAVLSLPREVRELVRPRINRIAAESPVPVPVQRAVSLLATAMGMFCGYFLLKGKNWARLVQIGWTAILFSYGFFAAPYKWPLLIGVVIEALIIYFLFRPQANAFFASDGVGEPIQNQMSKRRIASICSYIAAGIFLVSASIPALYISGIHLALTFFLFGAMSVIPLALVIVGKVLSQNSNWPREIGIVLLVSAVAAAMFVVGISMMFSRPEFLQTFAAERPMPEFHYKATAIWIGLLAAFGGTAFLLGGQDSSPGGSRPAKRKR